ncbi:MAG: molybdenum cofactor guanylyltransferase MobA [Pseudorhodoplanes sp.]
MTAIEVPPTLGLVLAGGRAQRMGGADKASLRLGNETLLARALSRLAPQCDGVIINANGDAARFGETGLPVVADSVADFAGPLAGVLAGLDWAAQHKPEIVWLASVPVDCPFFPLDLVRRLHEVRLRNATQLVCAKSGTWTHHVVALWRVDLREDMRAALRDEKRRKVEDWTARHGVAVADWVVGEVDPFFNINTPDDLAKAEDLVSRHAP